MDLNKKIETFETSSCHSLWLEEKKLKRNFDIYNYNYKKVILCIKNFEKKYKKNGLVDVKDWIFLSHKESRKIQIRFIPLFANFLSSLYALENNILEYSKKHDLESYYTKVLPYMESNIPRILLFALRNYFDHTSVYSINIGISYVRREKNFLPTNIWDRNVFFAINRIEFIADLQEMHSSVNPKGQHRFLKNPQKRALLITFLKKQKVSEINLREYLENNYSDMLSLFNLIVESVREANPDIKSMDSLLASILEEQYGYKEKIIIK